MSKLLNIVNSPTRLLVPVFLRFTVGASSGNVKSWEGAGVTSVTKESGAGTYTVVLDADIDNIYGALCDCNQIDWDCAVTAITQATRTCTVLTFDQDGDQAAGDASDDDVFYVLFLCRRTQD